MRTSRFPKILGLVHLLPIFAQATLFENVGDIPRDISYDFVVIGGGTAGAVVANRLTENSKINVLVIEAGPSNVGVLNSEVPSFAPLLMKSPFDWNFTTIPQPGLNGRSESFSRGHILGGSSAINNIIYTRGSSSDYNRFAAFTEDAGWSWDNILPFILKNEKWSPPADNHNTSGQFDPRFHNTLGLNAVSLPGYPQVTDSRIIQTTRELKDEFPFNLDTNDGNPLGVSWVQATIGNGTRSTSATSYLSPFINRKNLFVVVNTVVTRVLPSSNGGSGITPDAKAKWLLPTGSSNITFTAKKELILSAGSIGTPHILLNSGIGDQNELNKIGIKTIHHLPDVGKNLSDHLLLGVAWHVNSTETADRLSNNNTFLETSLAEWTSTRTGPLVDIVGGINQVGFFRLPDNDTIFDQFPDPSSGNNSAHFEMAFTDSSGLAFTTPPAGFYFGIGLAVLSPVSRGSVTLNQSDPLGPPTIDPNYLSSSFDIHVLRAAIRSAVAFVSAPVWKGYILEPAGPFASVSVDDDDSLDQYIRGSALTGLHPIGTSSMSPKGAAFGVVDPDLSVKGINGLRIVDASIMPFVICGHIQAPTYAVAERAASLIKSKWL
ncbi:pyranose dehydrogenase [Cyathus striatus]|nr:pyranose dehydrogenase [Cyathus striatus]